MKKIILASSSPQRKNLMKFTGLPFIIKPSNAEEDSVITTTCAALVKKNALLKAADVAEDLKEGIVIGSDTVVSLGKKEMLLKPKTLKQAKEELKRIMDKPQWVYSGVAMINASTGKTLIDYEKTKVFMNYLTDSEIDAYHKKVNPLNKAGGFDIEGFGNLFIRRIEGCYTNVIGLPMSKVKTMLQKFGVSVLGVMMMLATVGCSAEYNLATNQQEYLMYSTEKEVRMGAKVAIKINKEMELFEGVEENARVSEMLERIAAVCDRKDILYHIKIIDEDDVNAFAVPGGYIYLFRGLVEEAESDDQLVSVIAHEVAHITARHGIKRLQASYAALVGQVAAVISNAPSTSAAGLAIAALFTEYSQEAEMEADRLSVKYMRAAGFDPEGASEFMGKLKEINAKKIRQFSYFKSHPNPAKRIAVIREAVIGSMQFNDYLNYTENEF
ncbi:MAG: septum formation protein [Candidatus Omnitrophota bacterium]|jgi:septum formation protein